MVKTEDKFIQLQQRWVGRTLADSKNDLKRAELDEDYDKCIKIKNDIDCGIQAAKELSIDQYVDEKPYSYARLIFELLEHHCSLGKQNMIEIITQGGGIGYDFAFRNHLYRSVRIDNEIDLAPAYRKRFPTHPDCGSLENERTYIIEKMCPCKSDPASLLDITDGIISITILKLEERMKENG